MAILAGVVVIAAVTAMFWSTWQYRKSIRELAATLEARYPDVGQALGAPRWVYVEQGGGGDGAFVLQHRLPILHWLSKNDPRSLEILDALLFRRTRKLFLRALVRGS
ncbi:MAG: hypothetical protein O7H39_13375 [Gammaproteobacteria bacterium]|nr:hypothetical protein [Gammaproteobacteria bacterium]